MKSKKLSLDELKVKSFVIEGNDIKRTVKGGIYLQFTDECPSANGTCTCPDTSPAQCPPRDC